MAKEAEFGIVPVTTRSKQYSFSDAFLFMGSYAIATWNYSQGAYIASLVGFKQMLLSTIFGTMLALLIIELPVILATRYGIDIWIWFKSILGHNGVKVFTILLVVMNFTWHAVIAELFASSMENMVGLTGHTLPSLMHPVLALICVFGGGFIALRGVSALNITTKILTPLLILVGVIVIYVGFSSAPFTEIWNYVPETIRSGETSSVTGYILATDAMMAYSVVWFAGMAGVPRLTYTERSGYWCGPVGSGLVGTFFVVIGAVMAISMQYVTGESTSDPTVMMATLSVPAMALCSLLLVGFANIGTQATGSYLYSIMLKASFRKAKYSVLVMILCGYVAILALWGKILDHLGVVLTVGALVNAPVAALLFVDFFMIRKQKLSLRAAFQIDGNTTYRYCYGFNPLGFICIGIGLFTSLLICNPLTLEVHSEFFFKFTPTACSFIATAVSYLLLNLIPPIRKYNLRDRKEITV